MLAKENTVESLLGLSFKEMRQELQTVLLFLIFSGSVVINSMVFILFYKKPKLRTFSNRFILNLSLTHLLQAVVVMPYILFSGVFSEWPFGDVWCQISGFLLLYFSMETVFSLVLIAVDRNCAVNSPLHYSMTITKRKTGVFIAGTWFLAFFMCLPTLFGISTIKYRKTWHACAPVWINSDFCIIAYSILLITAGFAVPLFKLNCSYRSMFLIARSSSARTRRHAASLTEVHATGTQKSYAVHLLKKKSYRTTTSLLRQWSIFGNEWKAIKTGCLVIFSFILCWLPFFLVIGIEPYMKNESWMPGYFSPLVILLPLSASLINPYLYVFRNRTTFAYAKQLFYCGPSNKDRVSPKMRSTRHYVLRSGSKPVTFSTNLMNKNHQTLRECKVLRNFASKNCQVVDHANGSNTNQIDAHPNLNLEGGRVCYSQGFLASLHNQPLQRTCSSGYYSISPLSEHVFTFNLRPHLDCGSSSSETVDTGKSSIDSNDDNLSLLNKRFISRRNTCAAVLMRDEFNVKYHTLSKISVHTPQKRRETK
ncbi:histamine H2 receptor-like [Tachypleus tridentatus]|uniref:histamine H2 receptor-like n=1 Tax=Tachypleus tridentatus TaxID=6853 RepID=UPI003FD323F3